MSKIRHRAAMNIVLWCPSDVFNNRTYFIRVIIGVKEKTLSSYRLAVTAGAEKINPMV